MSSAQCWRARREETRPDPCQRRPTPRNVSRRAPQQQGQRPPASNPSIFLSTNAARVSRPGHRRPAARSPATIPRVRTRGNRESVPSHALPRPAHLTPCASRLHPRALVCAAVLRGDGNREQRRGAEAAPARAEVRRRRGASQGRMTYGEAVSDAEAWVCTRAEGVQKMGRREEAGA